MVQSPNVAGQVAPNLLERVKTEITDLTSQRQIIDVIETIIVYKFPQLSRY
nr:Rpn family recombination-promoting nuclease/putative transposase [Aphanothece hegewaldii]